MSLLIRVHDKKWKETKLVFSLVIHHIFSTVRNGHSLIVFTLKRETAAKQLK